MRLGGLVVILVLAAGESVAGDSPVRIMPLGDSITAGRTGDASYRFPLQEALAAGGIRFDFVGSQRDRSAPEGADSDHEAHWGWTTADVLERIDEWAKAARPDVVLLHLGTNDLGSDPERIAGNLASIIDRLRAANPRVAVLVARIIPAAGVAPERLVRTNDAIAAMAAARSSERSPIVVVDQHTGFDPRRHTYDGVHPNDEGDRLMARRWAEALLALLGRKDDSTNAKRR